MTSRTGLLVLSAMYAIAPDVKALDTAVGRDLYLFDENADMACTSCHDSAWFKDPSNRKAASFAQIKGWVQGCNQQFPHGWFPEEEDDVAAYLNAEYYGYSMD